MLSCIIVDDEPLSRSFLQRFCERSGRLSVKGSFASAEEAQSFLLQDEASIVFLDVEMPGINGFQLLDQLPYLPKVIMTTSKTDYAYTAFEYKVTDFLKKPIEYGRFLDALDKVEELVKHQQGQTENKSDVFIKSNGSYVRLGYDDILYIEGMGDYVKYVTPEKTYITHSTLRAVEETMAKDRFMKIHRSYIVNLGKIKDFTDNAVTIEGTSIPVSKSNKAILIEKLKTA